MNEQTLEQIRAIPILNIVERYVPKLKKKGKDHWAPCPMPDHTEKTPSFAVSENKNIFKCFGCGKGGDGIQFVMDVENMEFPDAVRQIADMFSIEIEDEGYDAEAISVYDILEEYADKWHKHLLVSMPQVMWLLNDRKINMETILKLRIGLCTDDAMGDPREDALDLAGIRESGKPYEHFAGRVVFPIQNITGRVSGFSGRLMKWDKTMKRPKYKNTGETEYYKKSYIVYGLRENRDKIREMNQAIVVEGQTDVAGLMSAGINNVCACTGTALTIAQAKLIKRYAEEIILLFDGDAAGRKAITRSVETFLQVGIMPKVAELPEGEDPDSLRKKDLPLLKGIIGNAILYPEWISGHYKKVPADKPEIKTAYLYRIRDVLAKIKDPALYLSWLQYTAVKLGVESHVIRLETAKLQHETFEDPNIDIKFSNEYKVLNLLLSHRDTIIDFEEGEESFYEAIVFKFGDIATCPMENPQLDLIRSVALEGKGKISDITTGETGPIYADLCMNAPPLDWDSAMKTIALFYIDHLARLGKSAALKGMSSHVTQIAKKRHELKSIFQSAPGNGGAR